MVTQFVRLFTTSMRCFPDTEQFGILCSIDGQIRQLLFRAIHGHNRSRTLFTDSMSSLSSMSTMSSCTRQTNHKTDILYQLAKAISDDRCLLDQVGHRCGAPRDSHAHSSLLSFKRCIIRTRANTCTPLRRRWRTPRSTPVPGRPAVSIYWAWHSNGQFPARARGRESRSSFQWPSQGEQASESRLLLQSRTEQASDEEIQQSSSGRLVDEQTNERVIETSRPSNSPVPVVRHPRSRSRSSPRFTRSTRRHSCNRSRNVSEHSSTTASHPPLLLD